MNYSASSLGAAAILLRKGRFGGRETSKHSPAKPAPGQERLRPSRLTGPRSLRAFRSRLPQTKQLLVPDMRNKIANATDFQQGRWKPVDVLDITCFKRDSTVRSVCENKHRHAERQGENVRITWRYLARGGCREPTCRQLVLIGPLESRPSSSSQRTWRAAANRLRPFFDLRSLRPRYRRTPAPY